MCALRIYAMEPRFSLLRTVLKALGLSAEAINDIVARIIEFLSPEDPRANEGPAVLPYRLRDDFLSPAEQSFCRVLRGAVDNSNLVMAKVSLGDLFLARSDDPSDRQRWTNKIDRKHVDFLLVDRDSLRPLAGVELDDRSHERPDRQARDAFVEAVFTAAGLPLIRFPARAAYRPVELRAVIATTLGRPPVTVGATHSAAEPPSAAIEAPQCPRCGAAMILRTAKSGARAGELFWGCAAYPKCRAIVSPAPQLTPEQNGPRRPSDEDSTSP